MARTSICAYPWDVIGDPHCAERLAGLGVDSVVLPAVYHSVRAATPQHPLHRVVDAPSAALYLPLRAGRWSEGALTPASTQAWGPPFSFARAAAELSSAGLDVEAWIVLTHTSFVGSANAACCVRNAFGDVYEYALCPTHEAVRTYATTLVSEVIDQTGSEALVIEASGPLGVSHLGHHEKTAGAGWTAIDESLLSLCFCDGCAAVMKGDGLDPDRLAERVRTLVGSRVASMEEALGDEATAVLAVRQRSTATLRTLVIEAARSRGVRRLTFHAQPGRWEVGPAAALIEPTADVDTYLIPQGVLAGFDAAGLAALRRQAGGRTLGAYVSAMPPANPSDLATSWAELIDAGINELCIYHGGLLSSARFTAVRDALSVVAA